MIIRILLIVFMIPFSVFSAELVLGTYPSNTPEKVEKAFLPLAAYLSGQTGHKVRVVVTEDYGELAERIRNGTVDIAWMGSVNYVKTKRIIPSLRYVATYMENGENTPVAIPYYQSFIVSRKDSNINTLEGLKGRMFAFTDRDSTSGYAYPDMMLRKKGIVPDEYFAKVFFLKKHDRIVQAILAGSVDAGGISDGTYYNAVKAHGEVLNIIEKSAPIPLDAIALSPGAPAGLDIVLRKILVDIPEDHKVNKSIIEHLGWPAAGFSVKDDSFYNSLREALGL